MRVAHVVCSGAFAGVERYVANVGRGLSAQGVDLTVIGGDPVRMGAALAGSDARWRPGATIGEAMRELRALSRPDLVNSHMSDADLACSLYRRVGRGVKHVSTRHFAAPRGSGWLARHALGLAASGIDADLAISDFVARSVEGPSEVVHSGVDVRPAASRRSSTVLMVQRLEAEKDTETAVRGWERSAARDHGWRLRIAGDGSQRAPLSALASELGVRDSIDFLGFRSDVDDLLSTASIFLAPTPREGLGIAVLEAMAHGIVVVASGSGGHLETAGVAAPELLFPPGDAGALAARLDALVADPQWRRRAGDAGQELQRSQFTLASQVRGTIHLYERILAS